MLTIGELYLSPVGLSLVTKVAPAKIVSMMMGVWFLATFFGNYIAGWIGGYYDQIGKDQFFLLLALLGFIPGLLFVVTQKVLNKSLDNKDHALRELKPTEA
jgi:POT family proton-dependent oligopeptide transporter